MSMPSLWKYKLLQGLSSSSSWGNFLVYHSFRLCYPNSHRSQCNLSFALHECRSRRHLAVTLADTDFEDHIVLVSDNIQNGIGPLYRAKEAVKQIGLQINFTKTEKMSFNSEGQVNITMAK